MEDRSHAVAAGLFVVVAALLTLWLGWWFTGKNEDTRELLVVARDPVTGLNPQGQVRFRGVKVGKISDISFDPKEPRRINIRVRVRSDVPLTRSSYAELEMQGVTGLAHVQLNDDGASAEPLPFVQGSTPELELRPGRIQELLANAQGLMEELRGVTKGLRGLATEDNLRHVQSTLARLDAVSGEMGGLARSSNDLVARVARVVSAENVRRLESTLASAESLGRQAAPLAGEIRHTLAAYRALGERLEALSGRLDQAVPTGSGEDIGRLFADLQRSNRRLEQLLTGLEEAPQRLILGDSPGAPGPGEEGFKAGR